MPVKTTGVWTAAAIGVVGLGLIVAPASAAIRSPQAVTAKAPGKTLVVTAYGLPATTKAKVRVTGPKNYKTTLRFTGSTTLRNLTPGTYTVKAKPVTVFSGKAKVVKQRTKKAKVKKNRGAAVTFRYLTPGTA
jgi:hypothetical protein